MNPETNGDEILFKVYRLDQKDVKAASFVVYDCLEELLYKGLYDVCDRILCNADVSKLSTTVMRSFLTITREAKHKLKERECFFTRVEQEMTRIRGAEMAERLLCRLK